MKEFKLLGYTFNKKEQMTWAQKAEQALKQELKPTKNASYFGHEYNIIETIFDGEKTQGELGSPLSYMPDYNALSFRSWQAYTESDIAQIIVKSKVNWVIGSGLKLQAEPISGVIDDEGFNFDKTTFIKRIEERFRLFAKTNKSTYSNMMNYNKSQRIAYMNAIIGGDVLVIDMMVDGLPSKRLIDGIFVRNPGMDEIEKARKRGNEIIHGVEVDKKKTHVAFYVINKDMSYTRIEAYGKNTGRLQAYLLYGSEYRIDSVRGMPLMSAVLEKIKKLDRYNEAIVAGAEESAKVPYVFEHNQFSDGTNPDLAKFTATITGEDAPSGIDVVDMSAQTTIVKRTFEKEPVNLPIGSKMVKVTGGMEVNQEVFTTGNFIYICAAMEVPYEVALMKYVNSFSSSRMASQSFLKLLLIARTGFNEAYNKPFYNLFLDSQILGGKVKADGYLSAMNKGDVILMEAYRNCRFTGPGVPQADPGKEVKAVIESIDANLLSHEAAMERLDNGDDFETTIDKLAEERKSIQDKMPKEENSDNSDKSDNNDNSK